MSVWRPLTDPGSGYLFSLSEALSRVERDNPGILVSVDFGTQVIASDYSGQHQGASHEAYSFLVATDETIAAWLPLRAAFRQRWLPDNRRISFKQLREPMRSRALPAFLAAAGTIRGNLITVLVDRRVGSFIDGGHEAAIEVFPDCFPPGSKPGTVEKMLRLASFIGFIQSGLRRECQPSYWISDHDEALDSFEKRDRFARLATYITVGLTRWLGAADQLFGTTEMSGAADWSEDLVAIADLAAGAYCKLSNNLPAFLGRPTWQVGISSTDILDNRARIIGDWLAMQGGQLRHVLLRLEKDNDENIRATAQFFRRDEASLGQ